MIAAARLLSAIYILHSASAGWRPAYLTDRRRVVPPKSTVAMAPSAVTDRTTPWPNLAWHTQSPAATDWSPSAGASPSGVQAG